MVAAKNDTGLTFEHVRQLFEFDPISGDLIWRIAKGHYVKAGDNAGSLTNLGYLRVGIDRKYYFVHRIIWLLVYGEWPKNEIDHVNKIRNDNRLINLRQATTAENCRNRGKSRNNKSGYKGVSFHRCKNKWRATIKDPAGKNIHIGYYNEPEPAHIAYCEEAAKRHGKFAGLEGEY